MDIDPGDVGTFVAIVDELQLPSMAKETRVGVQRMEKVWKDSQRSNEGLACWNVELLAEPSGRYIWGLTEKSTKGSVSLVVLLTYSMSTCFFLIGA
jgi:hypothetical protein